MNEARSATTSPAPAMSLARVGRLARKELRETLRDRRTIITLVIMPLLVYPILSLAFRQFLLSSFQQPTSRWSAFVATTSGARFSPRTGTSFARS